MIVGLSVPRTIFSGQPVLCSPSEQSTGSPASPGCFVRRSILRLVRRRTQPRSEYFKEQSGDKFSRAGLSLLILIFVTVLRFQCKKYFCRWFGRPGWLQWVSSGRFVKGAGQGSCRDQALRMLRTREKCRFFDFFERSTVFATNTL